MVKKDILRTWNRINGNKFKKIVGCYRAPGIHTIIIYQFNQWIKRNNKFIKIFLSPLYYFLYHRIRSKWGIKIDTCAKIDEGLYICHPGSVRISPDAIIGKNADISHEVTIGVSGQGNKSGVPVIGDNIYIAPGAKLFGKIRIGNNVKIGANAVIYKDIPDNAIVVLDPGFKIISYQGN